MAGPNDLSQPPDDALEFEIETRAPDMLTNVNEALEFEKLRTESGLSVEDVKGAVQKKSRAEKRQAPPGQKPDGESDPSTQSEASTPTRKSPAK